MGPETTARPQPGDRPAIMRPWVRADPQALARYLVIALREGCQTCGTTPGQTHFALSIGVGPETLKAFLSNQDRLKYPGPLERIEGWIWRALNPLRPDPPEAET